MKNKNIRWWDIPSIIFLLGALFSAAVRLQATSWTENLGRIELIVILGAIFGFALGKSIFSGRITFLMGLAYSVFVIPWQLGLLLPPMQWGPRLEIVYARVWYATADFISNRPVRDPILFLSTMMILYWFASLLASYRMVRHANPWLPLLSLGGMILVIEYTMEMYKYTTVSGGIYSFFYLVFCLLLMGRIYFLHSRKDWEKHGGTVEMEVGYDLGRGVAVAAVVVALLAWNTPRIINFFDSKDPARERVSEQWQAFRDRISKAANSLRSPNATEVQSYGNNMFLGTGGNQSDQVMFTVKPDSGRQNTRMYWAARSYDTYQNGQWETNISGTQQIGPGSKSITYPAWQMRREVQFSFDTRVSLLRTLYYTDTPLNISLNAEAVVAKASDGSTDLNAIVMDPPLKAGQPYTVRASLPDPTVLAMRESGTEYPDWVKQRYLQIPTNFSSRVTELARQIAGEEKTPYDKAMAVTQYLRRTITYTETVPEPPRNRDPLEWFLFDQRAGFCNYYASAEVMMLRSLGVPARLMVGYAEGIWDPEVQAYVVHGKDSHAWPEVYFPKLGWVIFEPTVSQPLSSYPLGEQANSIGSEGLGPTSQEPTFDPRSVTGGEQRAEELLNPVDQPSSPISRFLSVWTLLVFMVVVVAGLLVYLELRRRKTQDLPLPSWFEKALDEHGIRTPEWLKMWSRRSLRTPMENLFANISFMLRVWGHKVDPALTPAEQVALLVNTVPGVSTQAQMLLEEYHRAMYSQYPANVQRARLAVNEIRSIGYRTWLRRLVGLES